jgi:hypothetical protein
MKYMILIHSNPSTRQDWESFSDEEREEGWRVYGAIGDGLVQSGELIATEALADPSMSRRIQIRDGVPVATDGPFAEAKEHLAGFFLVDCESEQRAIEIAGSLPEAEYGVIELRPVLQLGAPDA